MGMIKRVATALSAILLISLPLASAQDDLKTVEELLQHSESLDAAPETAVPETSAAEAEAPEAEQPSLFDMMTWVTSGKGEMGKEAEIVVPDGYMFTDADGTIQLMRAMGNLTAGNEVGFFAPVLNEDDGNFRWFAVFEYDSSGHVKDDEKDQLDGDALMASMKEGEAPSNKERARNGYSTLHMVGWVRPPYYNDATQNLEWAFKFRSEPDGTFGVNHNTRLLGREGVMKVTLVCDPDVFDSALEEYQSSLNGFAFKDGRRYTDFRKGDKIAKYGLAGLVLGGGLAMAAKTGLLQKFMKPIIIGFIAIGAFFKRLFGRRSKD
jgi:uncharacterized membrane-anchored protein